VTCGLGPHTFRASCETAHGLRAGGLIAVLGGLRAEGKPTVATTTPEHAPLELLKRSIPGATNDAILELAYQVLENLAERAESAADFAIESDLRDVENEALVFAKEVKSLIGSFNHGRLREAEFKVHDAEKDLQKAIRNRRTALEGKRTALEQFSDRRTRRAHSAWEVELRREKMRAAKTLDRANITPERVMEALIRAQSVRPGDVRPIEVAVALMSELADTAVDGRQLVVAHVGKILRELVAEGRVVQVRPDDYDGRRKNCRYAVAGGDDA
jgi:hypothetical protein